MCPISAGSLDVQLFSLIHHHGIVHTRATTRKASRLAQTTSHLIMAAASNMAGRVVTVVVCCVRVLEDVEKCDEF